MSLSLDFQSILWEYDLSKLRLEDDIVVSRILSLGDKKITDLWVKTLGKVKAKSLFVKNMSSLDIKSLNYWGIIFGVDISTVLHANKTMYEKLHTPIFSRSFR